MGKACCSACASGAPKCGGRTLGEAPGRSQDQIEALRAQVNRFFASDCPERLRLPGSALPSRGPLDLPLATAAVAIYARRAREAYEANPQLDRVISRARIALDNPLAFASENLGEVYETVAMYGDMNDVPPARNGFFDTLGIPASYIFVAAALGAYLYYRRK